MTKSKTLYEAARSMITAAKGLWTKKTKVKENCS